MNKLGIRNQVKGLLARNDTTTTIIDGFIEQALARIQRTLRVPAMEKALVVTTGTVDQGTIILPSDFLRMKHLFTSNLQRNYAIEYVDVGTFIQTPDSPGYIPKIYTRIQGELKVKPSPQEGTQLTMIYYAEIPDLVADTDTNFLTELAPDLLIYTALSFASDYYIDDRKDQFEGVAQRAYQELMDQAYETEMVQDGMMVQTSFNQPEY